MRKNYVAKACVGPVLAFFTERNDAYCVWAEVFGSDENFHTLPPGQRDVLTDSARASWMSALGLLIRR